MEDARTFTNRLADLLARERAALGDFLVALADFDRQRLWLQLGYASLFDFLRRELGLSKASASFRKKAAELVQRFPEITEPLRDGRLCLTSVFELAKVLTPENRDEVLPRFFQLGKREAKAVVAALSPAAVPRREVVTTVRAPSPAEVLGTEEARGGAVVVEKLEAARAALSHSHPGANMDEILETALDLVLERHAKRRGLVEKPRREPPAAKPDHVPAHVRRAVWQRDGGRCQWPLASGGICGSTHKRSRSITCTRGRGADPRRSTTCASSAESTTTSPHARCSEAHGWSGSPEPARRRPPSPTPGRTARPRRARGSGPPRGRASPGSPR